MRMLCTLVVTTLITAPVPAMAQQPFDSQFSHVAAESVAQGQEPVRKLIISERAIALGLAANAPAPAQVNRPQSDSLKNGTIIGAVIGAVGMGIGVGLLCKALQEPSDPSCWTSVGVGALYGVGIGALGGLGIDALMTRSPRAVSPVLFQPGGDDLAGRRP